MSRFGGYEGQPFLAQLYDFVPAYEERPDLEFYLDFSRVARGKILELGCGTGRILIPTARAGAEITGLDISEYMLAKCREKLQGEPVEVQGRVQLVHGTMAGFNLNDTFNLVTTPFRSFQHLLSVEEQLACLRCVNDHLRPGGTLILDLFQVDLGILNNPDYAKETEDFSDVNLPNGGKLRRTGRIAAFHRAEQYNDVELIHYVTHPDGRVERLVQAFPYRYFFRYEVEHLLARCGFKVVDVFGSYDKSPLADDSPEMIFVAEKERNPSQ
ncbi:MAG: class I SAM-dependent methyltransferase [Candidatus Hydrogenedentota bacterium]|nr:MAG: class I SAM-dependent methyltransferase [Candidatus Hydrogenedentota bacterium]